MSSLWVWETPFSSKGMDAHFDCRRCFFSIMAKMKFFSTYLQADIIASRSSGAYRLGTSPAFKILLMSSSITSFTIWTSLPN